MSIPFEAEENSYQSQDDEMYDLNSEDVLSNDLGDVELLEMCSREDLFQLLADDPKYYCELIRKNKLCDRLSVKINRSHDGGGLNIKFRIYPEDRWCEVGYWGDATDEEIYRDFKTQILNLLNRNRSEKKSSRSNHLISQLDANNDIQSPDYGQDIKNFKSKSKNNFKTELEKQMDKYLCQTKIKTNPPNNQSSGGVPLNRLKHVNASSEVILEQVNSCTPIDTFIQDELLPQIYGNLAQVVNFDVIDLPLIHQLISSKLAVPKKMEQIHQNLIDDLEIKIYLQKMQTLFSENNILSNEAVKNFHQTILKDGKGNHYQELDLEKVTEILSKEDHQIIESYHLNILEIWTDHLKSNL